MASSTSSDLKLELMTTGEKSGQWGTITNTNLQILEQATSGYLSLDVASSDVALSLSNFTTSNGKNLYYKLTGTLAANRTVTMPDSAERVFIVEDATVRSASHYTLTVKTVSGTGVVMPVGSKIVLYSDGTNISSGPITKGFNTVTSAYTAISGDQILANTTGGAITITLPTSPSTGDEVSITDARGTFATNNLTINRNGQPIESVAANDILMTNGQFVDLVYVDATRGWAFRNTKDRGYTTVTANVTGIAGDQILANTTGGAFTVTLPASPTVGDEVTITDARGTFATNNLTIGRNGQPIESVAANDILITNGQSVNLVYVDGTRGWAYKGLKTRGYTTVTANVTVIPGDQILANTTGGVFTVTLPASPAVGDEVVIVDARGTFATNNLTVARNSQPINTGTSDLTLSTNGQAITLVYVDSTRGWAFKTNTA